MARLPFVEKWKNAQLENGSKLAIGLTPRAPEMPLPIMRYDDPFMPFGRAIIESTQDLVCAYVFDLASYLALGAAGARSLERTIPMVPRNIPVILHGPFITEHYATAAFEEAFDADAVTLATADLRVVHQYTRDTQHGAFVLEQALQTDASLGKNVGLYSSGKLNFNGSLVSWVTDPIIYASAGVEFKDDIRRAAEQYREKSLIKDEAHRNE